MREAIVISKFVQKFRRLVKSRLFIQNIIREKFRFLKKTIPIATIEITLIVPLS